MLERTEMTSREAPPRGTRWKEAELRQLLSGQLAGVLGVRDADVDPLKSFDDYGLDSIDAVVATEWIGKCLGIELPPEFLFNYRSIQAIIEALLNGDYLEGSSSARREKEIRIFYFAGAGGNDEPALIRFREQTSPTLLFETVRFGSWHEWREQGFKFDELAERACSHIQAACPNGPLRLAGYSQGGQLAYVTALALARAGRCIEFVGLLDSGSEDPRESISPKTRLIPGILGLGARYAMATIGRRENAFPQGDIRMHVLGRLWELRSGPELLMLIAPHVSALLRASASVRLNVFIQMRLFARLWSQWLAQNGSGKSLDAPVVLFRSDDPGLPDLGWSDFCSNLTVVQAPGDHHTMFNAENLEQLTRRFIAAVDRVD
jgi:thioesterase domain-containing protein/acyl carrier protein